MLRDKLIDLIKRQDYRSLVNLYNEIHETPTGKKPSTHTWMIDVEHFGTQRVFDSFEPDWDWALKHVDKLIDMFEARY